MRAKKRNVPWLVILIASIVFLNGSMSIFANDQCTCISGTFVKFNWDENLEEFVLDGTNASGIEITHVGLTDEGEPECVYWVSHDNWVSSVCIKAGNDPLVTNECEGDDRGNGFICIEGQNAISNIVFCLDGPMPVEMTSFTATIKNDIASLEWETATEVNNYGFEVERSTQPNDWHKIGFVEGHGNSNSPKYYSFTDKSVSQSGSYFYRLKQIDIDGSYEYSDAVEIMFSAPDQFALDANYPNPFNPTTVISYSIPADGNVDLVVHDVLGNEVAVLENGFKSAGKYSVTFNAANLASGFYFYTVKSGKFFETRKMLLIK